MVSARLMALAAPALVAALVIANAWAGLMPGVGFWDTGEFQTVLPIMGTAHPTGYPTYVLLGFLGNILLTPIGEPAFRVNALSLIAVGVAAGATVVLVRRLTGSMVIGAAAGLGLATTPLVWSNAMRADPHPIHLAFVALLLLALVRWEHRRRDLLEADADPRGADRRLVVAAVVFGLAAGNHSLTLLLVPAIALYVLTVEPAIWKRWRLVATCLVAAFGTVALVYLELPIRASVVPAPLVYGEPSTWDGFWYIALAEQFRGALGNPFGNLPAKLDELVTFAGVQLGVLAVAIPPAFLIAARRAPRYTLLTGITLLVTVVFNKAYSNADISRYYLVPILIVWTWIGILAAELADLAAVLVANLTPGPRPVTFESPAARRLAGIAAVVAAIAMLAPAAGDLNVRRDAADRSGDRVAADWLAQALPAVARDAVLVSWWSTSTPLWYAQKVQSLRPDIDILDDRTLLDRGLGRAPDAINRYLGTRPVYVIRMEGRDTNELLAQFDMQVVAGAGNTAVWRVNGRLAASQ